MVKRGTGMYGWDGRRKVVLDHMGFPISISEAKVWVTRLTAHINQGPAAIAGQCYDIVVCRFPDMLDQMDMSPERFE